MLYSREDPPNTVPSPTPRGMISVGSLQKTRRKKEEGRRKKDEGRRWRGGRRRGGREAGGIKNGGEDGEAEVNEVREARILV